ncbi:hypothetical protein JW859_01575 [bacterium]|nr:hypothetical protein [bacterium]
MSADHEVRKTLSKSLDILDSFIQETRAVTNGLHNRDNQITEDLHQLKWHIQMLTDSLDQRIADLEDKVERLLNELLGRR